MATSNCPPLDNPPPSISRKVTNQGINNSLRKVGTLPSKSMIRVSATTGGLRGRTKMSCPLYIGHAHLSEMLNCNLATYYKVNPRTITRWKNAGINVMDQHAVLDHPAIQHAPDFEKMDELQRNIREGMTPAKWAS